MSILGIRDVRSNFNYYNNKVNQKVNQVATSFSIGTCINLKMTGETVAREIKNTYDVTLNIGNIRTVNDLISTYDIQCKNYVGISQETLAKMEENPILKKKVMYAIEEFCSSKEQAKINALQPPVKSAGMIIYPDGDTLYWLEGYPNDFGNTKDKKVIVSGVDINNTQKLYESTSISGADNDMESAMQILGTAYMRKDKYK